jgi:hypothetical protein
MEFVAVLDKNGANAGFEELDLGLWELLFGPLP